MEQASAAAAYRELHEDQPYHDGTFTNWSASRSAAHPYHFDDGVTIGVTPVDHGLGGRFAVDPVAPQHDRPIPGLGTDLDAAGDQSAGAGIPDVLRDLLALTDTA
jgi:hypothetical protein